MNIRLWILLSIFIAVCCPLDCRAESNIDVIEQLSSGSINWTQGVVVAWGRELPGAKKDIDQAHAANLALKHALLNLHATVNRLRVSDCHLVSSLLTDRQKEYRQVKEMVMAAKVIDTRILPDGMVEVGVQMSLFGGFAQLVLPGTVRQVEPIKPLTPSTEKPVVSHVGGADAPAPAVDPDPYTGLIVDARGIGVLPSMVPVIVDESGQEVYGPEYVSREFAVQNGMCQYARWGEAFPDIPRVAPNPLVVKGLRMITGSCSRIVVSNADASKLRGSSLHLGFLKECRVVVALDGKK